MNLRRLERAVEDRQFPAAHLYRVLVDDGLVGNVALLVVRQASENILAASLAGVASTLPALSVATL